jgi:hypothetical protein
VFGSRECEGMWWVERRRDDKGVRFRDGILRSWVGGPVIQLECWSCFCVSWYEAERELEFFSLDDLLLTRARAYSV